MGRWRPRLHQGVASLRTIAAQPTVFSYGTVETNKGLAVQSPDGEMGIMTSFAALTKNVPEPFKKELNALPSDDERLKTVAASMDKIFNQAGLT